MKYRSAPKPGHEAKWEDLVREFTWLTEEERKIRRQADMLRVRLTEVTQELSTISIIKEEQT